VGAVAGFPLVATNTEGEKNCTHGTGAIIVTATVDYEGTITVEEIVYATDIKPLKCMAEFFAWPELAIAQKTVTLLVSNT
jgi:hypothetical protein